MANDPNQQTFTFTRHYPHGLTDTLIRTGTTVWEGWQKLRWAYDPALFYTVSTNNWHGHLHQDAQGHLTINQFPN